MTATQASWGAHAPMSRPGAQTAAPDAQAAQSGQLSAQPAGQIPGQAQLLDAADQRDLRVAASLLRQGQVVALPTETVYGLAGNALDPQAVESIYAAKGRPSDNPLIVHVTGLGQPSPTDQPGPTAWSVCKDIPPSAYLLARTFWPGPLTLVLPKQAWVPSQVAGGGDTVGVRAPDHPAFQAVLQYAGFPLAAPSANRAGSPSPTTAAHVMSDLGGAIPAVLDGGPCRIGLESTVLSLVTPVPRLLRPGAVSLEDLRQLLGRVDVDPAIAQEMAPGQLPGSPGMKYRHYAPAAPVTVVTGSLADAVAFVAQQAAIPGLAVVCFDDERAAFEAVPGVTVVTYGRADDADSLARGLFQALRAVDSPDVAVIFARCPSEVEGMYLAVRNRLRKAAAFREITLPATSRSL